MTLTVSREREPTISVDYGSLLGADDVIPQALEWRKSGSRVALVTLVGIDGGTPRPLGAQMAVTEEGRFCGYLSGGCLERAVALEARAAITAGSNKLVRFGRGSKYFDIQLPCGSAIELYIDQDVDDRLLDELRSVSITRTPAILETDLETGRKKIRQIRNGATALCRRNGWIFSRSYLPPIRLVLIGSAPILSAIAKLGNVIGFDLVVCSPDDTILDQVRTLGSRAFPLTQPVLPDADCCDAWTASILVFHDHHWEPPLLSEILSSDCFYVGVLGSKSVHADRIAAITQLGIGMGDISRIRAPIGSIPNAKSVVSLATGIVAEVVATARAGGLVW